MIPARSRSTCFSRSAAFCSVARLSVNRRRARKKLHEKLDSMVKEVEVAIGKLQQERAGYEAVLAKRPVHECRWRAIVEGSEPEN